MAASKCWVWYRICMTRCVCCFLGNKHQVADCHHASSGTTEHNTEALTLWPMKLWCRDIVISVSHYMCRKTEDGKWSGFMYFMLLFWLSLTTHIHGNHTRYDLYANVAGSGGKWKHSFFKLLLQKVDLYSNIWVSPHDHSVFNLNYWPRCNEITLKISLIPWK